MTEAGAQIDKAEGEEFGRRIMKLSAAGRLAIQAMIHALEEKESPKPQR